MDIFTKIKEFLDNHTIDYEIKEHPPTRTSEEAAAYRGEPLKIGAKAMVLKIKDGFVMAVIPADRKIDSKKLKAAYGKKLRFATEEELLKLTGLKPGSVPPFGPLLGIPMIVDTSLFEEEYMAFNAGSLERSIKMKTADYRKALNPIIGDISA